MSYNSKAFGIAISRLRVSKGYSQEKTSTLARVARSHLAALENGDKTVKLDTLWRIAEALEIAPSELIRIVEEIECSFAMNQLPQQIRPDSSKAVDNWVDGPADRKG